MKVPLDSYSLRARFFPAIIVVVPVVAAIAAWLPLESPAWKTLASVGALAALAVLLSHLARDLGKRKEKWLFEMWGGVPSTRFLRHRDATLPEATRDRYHTRLAALVPEIEMPSSRSEKARPDAADAIYTSCTDWLREKTRDREKFHLLFEENVSYGFRRNLWAMKPAGLFLSLASLFASAGRLSQELLSGGPPSVETVAALLVSTPLLVWWVSRITPGWVAQSADAYGQRLLAACDEL